MFRSPVKQTTTWNLYITIYIYFLDGHLCEVEAVRRRIRIILRCKETTHTAWRWERFREQRDLFFTAFSSILRPYITFKLPRGDMDTPPQFLPISGDRDVSLPLTLEWLVWSSSSGNNCHAVHRSLSSGASFWSGTFTLSHIISRAHLRDFFRLLTIGMCHFRYLRNGGCDRHRTEITIMQFTGHSLPVHHSVVYHGNYLVPFHQPISAHAISSPNCHWNVSLPSSASPWNSIFWGPGRRSKHNTFSPLEPVQSSLLFSFLLSQDSL